MIQRTLSKMAAADWSAKTIFRPVFRGLTGVRTSALGAIAPKAAGVPYIKER
jgi:hypothetical protein